MVTLAREGSELLFCIQRVWRWLSRLFEKNIIFCLQLFLPGQVSLIFWHRKNWKLYLLGYFPHYVRWIEY